MKKEGRPRRERSLYILGPDGTEHRKSASLKDNMTKHKIYGALDVSYMN